MPELAERGLAPDAEFLLLCAQIKLGERDSSRLCELAASGLPWEDVFRKSSFHRLTPLVSRHLRNFQLADRLPRFIWRQFEDADRHAHASHLASQHECLRLLRAFQEAGIPVIPLKGVALTMTVYERSIARIMADIDLLVRPSDRQKAQEVLSCLGYQESGTGHLTSWHARMLSSYLFQMPFQQKERNVVVDLHWGIIKGIEDESLDVDRLFRHASLNRHNGVRCLLLAHEDMLMHLCLHLYRLAGSSTPLWIWITDIVEVCRQFHESFRWGYFESCIQEEGVAHQVLAVLRELHTVGWIVVPDHLARREGTVKSFFIDGMSIHVTHDRPYLDYGKLVLQVHGWSNKIRLVLAVLCPPVWYLRNHLNNSSSTPAYQLYWRYWLHGALRRLKGRGSLLAGH